MFSSTTSPLSHNSHLFRTLQTRQQGSSFLADLKQKLLLPPSEAASAGTRYNVPLINSLVLYVGMQVLGNASYLYLLFSLEHEHEVTESVEVNVFISPNWCASIGTSCTIYRRINYFFRGSLLFCGF